MTAGAMETQPGAAPHAGRRARSGCSPPRARRWRSRSGSSPRAGACPATSYSNTLPRRGAQDGRRPLFAGAVAAAGCGPGPSGSRGAPPASTRSSGSSRRLAPLCLAAFVPLLFHWQLWTGPRELTFAVLASGFGLSLQPLMRVALAAPPLLPRTPARAHRRRARRRRRDGSPARPGCRAAIVAIAVLRYAIFFSIITIRNHYNLQTAGYDLGIENNLVWNAAHWNGPLFKTSVQMGGPVATHIGLHQTYISYLIGIPYRLVPRPETLLVLQSLLIGAAALPLYAYARRHLGAWTACLVALLCLFYAPLHGSNLYDFHYLPFAPFFLWTTLALLDGAPRSLGGGRDRADAGQPRGHVGAAGRGRPLPAADRRAPARGPGRRRRSAPSTSSS